MDDAAESSAPTQPSFNMDIVEIQTYLPHRYPFLFVDRIIELEIYKRAVGLKNVTFNEPFFLGHFPERAVMPGVLILEAMAHGLPVVAASVGGVPEAVVDGVTGLLVPPGDSPALATAILELVADPARRRALGHAGRERIDRHFSMEAMIRAYEDFYSEFSPQRHRGTENSDIEKSRRTSAARF